MVEEVDNVVIGAGPAGLRAAQVLAEAGREVVVLEKNEEVGPKTCAGGLTQKAVGELTTLGLPEGAGLDRIGHASFGGDDLVRLAPEHAAVRTLSRRRLGGLQAGWARAAGAELLTGTPARRIDLDSRMLDAGGRRLRYRRLIGADGSTSAVRRALGLPTPRPFFAAEFNVHGLRLDELVVAFDSDRLASGYFWIFPHEDYTSIGAGVNKSAVPPGDMRLYLERRAEELGVDLGSTPFEGATIETEFVGLGFGRGVHLAGDAAGTASGLTAEGIYAALITGEEVARGILEPGYPMRKTKEWLRVKRIHDAIGRLWLGKRSRELSLAALEPLFRRPLPNRWLSAFFLAG